MVSPQRGFRLLRESAAHHARSSLLLVLDTLPSCRWSKPELKRDSCAPVRTGTISQLHDNTADKQPLRTIRGPYMGYLSACLVQRKSLTVAQTLKNMPAMRETWVRSLGWEDPQEKRMATHFSILAWRIP